MADQRVTVVDSHTGGEPTRVVIGGGPSLGDGPLCERRQRFSTLHDSFRSAVVNEPRGSDVLVGAMLCEPHDPDCDAGVIFFNNVGMLGMCGHGAMGLAVTLRHLGRVGLGALKLDTPVGPVTLELQDDHRVTVHNVASYRYRQVTVEVSPYGAVTGDVAWGGNWFFLTPQAPVEIQLSQVTALTSFAAAVRQALQRDGVTGVDGAEIDHIEVFGPPQSGGNSRNFVLCPGGAYDRSPCGTGTSAKVACLAADGKLAVGQIWRQESVVGSIFDASYTATDVAASSELESPPVLPAITGSAFVTAESTLLLQPADPFCWGVSPQTQSKKLGEGPSEESP